MNKRVSTILYFDARLASGNMKVLTITVPTGKTHLPSSAGGRQPWRVAGSGTQHSAARAVQSLTWIFPPLGNPIPRLLHPPSAPPSPSPPSSTSLLHIF